MAAIENIDGAMGLIPMATPLESQTVKRPVTSGLTVYPGMVVKNVAGSLTPHVAGGSGVDIVGVCLDYAVGIADLSVEATVCVDPGMVYRCLSDGAVQAGDYGFFGDQASNGGSATTLLSTGVMDDASFDATPLVTLPFQHLGPYDVVTSAATNNWILVRLTTTLYSDRFGLAS
jgi:hypothetical protein